MALPLPQPVLADGQLIGFVIFVVVMIMSWIVKVIGGVNQAAPPARGRQPQPPRSRGDGLQREIDRFLREVGGGRKRGEEVAIEIVPEQERQRPRQKPRPKTRPPAAQPPETDQHVKPGTNIAQRESIVSKNLGAGLREHLQEYMENRVEEHAEEHLSHNVEASVFEHLGEFTGGAAEQGDLETTHRSSAAARQIVSLLRDPDGIQQAILINEILSRPLTRRHS